MKRKKTFGLFGTNKRRPVRKADKEIEQYYDTYEEEEYESEEYDPDEEDGEYYEDGEYTEEYEEEAYEDEMEYARDSEYEDKRMLEMQHMRMW